MNETNRPLILRYAVIALFAILLIRIFYIQIIDRSYRRAADNNVLRYEVLNPPRGEIYDRNGEFLAQSVASYDLMVVPRNIPRSGFDTVGLARVAEIPPRQLADAVAKAKRYSQSRASIAVKQLSQKSKLLFDEGAYDGFYTVYRTQRSYPRKIGGNLLGYVGQVNDQIIARNPYYTTGDYMGLSGIEGAYEDLLRGERGVKIDVVDVHGSVKGSYADGAYDTAPIAGTPIVSTIDAELQQLAEELMLGKVGSIIALDPASGEILVMVSSPTYDPDELMGRDRGNNYVKMLDNKRQPLFNRAVMSSYPPGSTFKLVNGLIGLQEGVLYPNQKYPCHDGYTVGRGVKCHHHSSPLDLRQAVSTSCNAYFCYVLRNILDNPAYGGIMEGGYDNWEKYVRSFGFGSRLGSDFSSERAGFVPSSDFYTKRYRKWNSLTVISLAIGQGELGCSPLQMANLAATIANRGYYYIPHIVKEIEGQDSIDSLFFKKHYTMVDSKHFEPIIDGMYGTVHGSMGTARIADVEGLEICGKTGTAQNPHGKDHSTFLAFAPKNEPKIAISVYVENGGFGSAVAAPIASLLMEKYLTGKISRDWLVDYVKKLEIYYPNYAE
ncbi:MAG: penicillin-binding protein 2 [Tidjanibacter sp.]|nr:penicillin-binding protein 2 [Tidjanibacter sp.]